MFKKKVKIKPAAPITKTKKKAAAPADTSASVSDIVKDIDDLLDQTEERDDSRCGCW